MASSADPDPSTASSVAWPELPGSLRDITITSADAKYRLVRSNYMKVGSPRLVIMAESEDQVADAVMYAASVREESGLRVPFSFRSGGHGMSGSSVNDDGIILDISHMRRIEIVDAARGLVRVQAGATWGDVAEALQPHDLVITSGNFGDTGVGGLATSGGVGFFVRSQGLTIDRIRGARVIIADGTSHWTDADHDPDLFWAVRGGGSQIGITTEFLFQAARLGSENSDTSVINQMAQYVTTDLPGFVSTWGRWIRESPREMTSFLMLQLAGDDRVSIQAINVWAGTDTDKASPVIETGAQLGRLTSHHAFITPYPNVVPTPRAQHLGQQQIRLRDVLVDRADSMLGQAFVESFAHQATVMGELRSIGGAMNDVPADATAWAGRHQEALAATWVRAAGRTVEDESFAPIRQLGTGAYGAYSSDTSAAAADLAWPGMTGVRLRRIAQRVDPHGLFDQGLHLARLRQ